MVEQKLKIKTEDLSVWFDGHQALRSLNLQVFEHEILGVIGPANSGKSTFLRAVNRLNDLNDGFKRKGRVLLDGQDIYPSRTKSAGGRVYEEINVGILRKRVGMVFALPVVLPLSIFENVVYGPRRHGVRDKNRLSGIVEKTLKDAYLWDEVKDRLNISAMKLSGGQQQRLCLARTLAVEPEVILYDEPCSGLDPISTAKIEEAMLSFKTQYTQILVTNNTKQAARVADRTAFFLMGELVELDTTDMIFTSPRDQRTNDYISGRFG